MKENNFSFSAISLKSTIVHTVSYFVIGLLAFTFFDYSAKFADPIVANMFRQTDHPLVVAGPLFQVLRGFLFGVVFYFLREIIFPRKHGWLILWLVFVIVGIISPFGAALATISARRPPTRFIVYSERKIEMQITRKADYAVRAIMYLARIGASGDQRRVVTSSVAKEQNIPSSFLTKIIAELSMAGLLDTLRGAHGGVRLARRPLDITLLEVVEAIDGPIQLNVCVEAPGTCPLEPNCSVRMAWYDAQNELVSKLRNTNFAQLIT